MSRMLLFFMGVFCFLLVFSCKVSADGFAGQQEFVDGTDNTGTLYNMNNDSYFDGLFNDFIILTSPSPYIAHDPNPVDEGSTNASPVVLSWSPGCNASSHDVYFGTNQAAVSTAQRDIGDLHGDGLVDWLDLNVLGGQWLRDIGAGTPNDLAGWWKFDEGTGDTAYDSSGNGNTGTLYNMEESNWIDGEFGDALNFDNSYVEVPDDNSLDFADEFSLSCWAKADSIDAIQRLIYRYDAVSKDGYYLSGSNTDSGKWQFAVFVNPDVDYVYSDSPPSGDWQHVAGLRDAGGELYIYVDGELQIDTASISGEIDSTGKLHFGCDMNINFRFDGIIDDIRIYNTALSPQQIDELSLGASPANLNNDEIVNFEDFAIFAADWQLQAPFEFKGNQTNDSYSPGPLAEGNTYYWRIDEVKGPNTYKGDVWSFSTTDAAELDISMLEPNAYEVKYDSFNVGELMYVDRTYTFTNVASLAGETYIKTANDDKYLTNEVRVVFNINQDCTVYVAFDDRISPNPAWLSDFTDTGENISTGSDPYSLYAKDFDAGTVVLGGNSGDVSSSMYGIIVAAKGAGFIIRPEVTNDNFEYPDVSGYQYSPSGSDWSYTGNFIIADSGSAFGNTAYEGSQNMVMQGPVTVWQDVNGFEVGKTYVVRWVEADRAGGAGDNSLRVWIDDTIVGAQHTVDDENWDVIRSTEFVATSYTHTLKFETLTSGDHSAFIDAVSVSEYLSVKDWLRSRPFLIYGLNQFADDPGCNNITQYTAAGLNNLMAWFEVSKKFNGGLGQASRACTGGLPWHGQIEIRSGLDTFKYKANLAGSYCGQNALLVQDEPFGNEIEAMAKAAYWHKRHYPTIPLYSNNKGPQNSEDLWGDSNYPPGYDWDDYMDDQINKFDADALMYDYYPFQDGSSTSSGWWSQLMQVRNKALSAGIPCFAWVQAWQNYNHRLPSESDLRMYIFVHLAAGYQGFGYFTYSYFGDNSMLDASNNPTALYYDAAEINPEIINLGYCLRYLSSSEVRFVPGELFAGYENSTPSGWTDWSSGAGGDTHITNVDIDYSQGGTYGSKKNGVIGFFTDDAGQKYFMLTNTNHAAATDPESLSVPFIIDFESGVNELLELNRETGNAQVVPLTSHRLSITLLGGCGRLYKYSNGVGFAPDVPLP